MHVAGSQVARYGKKPARPDCKACTLPAVITSEPQIGRATPPVRNSVYCSSYSALRSQATASEQQRRDQQYGQDRHPAHGFVHRSLAPSRVYRSAMRMIGYRLLAATLALMLLTAAGDLPTTLRGAVSTSRIGSVSRHAAIRQPCAPISTTRRSGRLKHAGFDLRPRGRPTRPAVTIGRAAQAVARLQRHGLAVIVALYPADWHLETSPADQAKLLDHLALTRAAAARFDPASTFPEVLNEPVFASDPAPGRGCSIERCTDDPRRPADKYHRPHRGRLGQHRRSPVAAARVRTPT